LDSHLAELHVADAVRDESISRRSEVRGRWRRKLLRGPGPQVAAPRQQMLRHIGGRTARARVLDRECDDLARGAPAADQLRCLGGPCENALRHWDSSHLEASPLPRNRILA